MVEYDQIVTFFVVLCAICSVVVLFDNARKSIKGLKAPCKEHSTMLDNDNKRLNGLDESTRLLLRCQMQMMTHMIDGNHVEQLKETRDEVQDFLINK